MHSPQIPTLNALWESLFRDPLLQPYEQLLENELSLLLRATNPLHTLPDIICRSLQVKAEPLVPLSLIWGCIFRAAKLFDDLQDGESEIPVPDAINSALGLLWISHTLIASPHNGLTEDVRLKLLNQLHPALLRATAGQQLDIEQAGCFPPRCTPDEWMTIAAAKSGELLGWVTWAAAFVCTESSEVAGAYAQFGRHLGILLQVLDDFEGVWGATGTDLSTVSLSLPLCYALSVIEDTRAEIIIAVLAKARTGDPASTSNLRSWLEEAGAREFLWVTAQEQAQQAVAALRHIKGVKLAVIQELLTALFPFFRTPNL